MLSEDVIEKLGERLTLRIDEANEYILNKIAESVKRIGSLSFSEAQQLAQILKTGGDYNKIVKKLAETTNLNINDIKKILTEVAKEYHEFVKPFYEFRQVPFIPFEENDLLKKEVEAIRIITEETYKNISRTSGLGYLIKDRNKKNIVFRSIDYVYNEVIDRAVMSIAQGKATFDEEMYRIMKDIGKSGLRYIEYESGNIRRLDSAVRMNLLDGIRDLNNKMQLQFGEEFDADGVEISVHAFPASDHAKTQGRQFSLEEYDKLQETGKATTYDGIKVNMHLKKKKDGAEYDTFRPISQYNCYHKIFPIVLGVSEPLYSNEELKKILEENAKGFDVDGKHYRTKYEGTQMQRQLETRIREEKDKQILAKKSGNRKLAEESQKRINQLTDKYNEFSKKAGLPTKKDRLRVSEYRAIKVKK